MSDNAEHFGVLFVISMSILRLFMVALGFALFWFAFAWLASASYFVALFFFIWIFIFAPLILPPLAFSWMKLTGRLVRLDLNEPSPLRDYVLHCVLREGALHADFWLLKNSSDAGIFWFEKISFRGASRTQIILSKRWTASSFTSTDEKKEFLALWRKIKQLGARERIVRTAQISIWISAVSPLEFFSIVFDKILIFLGVKDMPSSVFWCQRAAMGLKEFCFSPRSTRTDGEGLSSLSLKVPRVVEEPLYWNSWSLGPWSLYPACRLHPAWLPLSHPENLLFF